MLAFLVALALLAPTSASAIQVDSQPSVSGGSNPPYETETLTANDGSYSLELLEVGPISTSRRWQRCDETLTTCNDTGDTGSSYTLGQDDVGFRIRLQVDATCTLCSPATGTSDATGVVRDFGRATFTRGGSQQRTLTAGAETTTGKSTASLSRRWLRCSGATEASCAAISGATGTTYKLVTADVGKRVRLRLTPPGDPGSLSADTGVIAANPPIVSTAPRVSGATVVGSTLSSTPGAFSGEAPISVVARNWFRCAAAGCTPIPGATGSTYTLSDADVGHQIRVAVTAEGLGRRDAASLPTEVVGFPDVPPSTPPPAPSPDVLSPFPRIGIAGRARTNSTRLTKFLVRAPRGSRITVRCRGRGCPFRRATARAGRRAVRFRRLQRSFRRGLVVEVFITSPGKIGKYTRFRFRRRRAPSRVDGCLQPGARRPSPCP